MESVNKLVFKEEGNKDLECSSIITCLNRKNPFLKRLIKYRDLEGISLIINEDNSNPILLEDLFVLKINVKSVGTLVFFFKHDSVNKDEIIPSIQALKDMSISCKDDAIKKVDALFNILAPISPLFIAYDGDEYDNYLTSEEISKYNIFTLYTNITIYKYDTQSGQTLLTKSSSDSPSIIMTIKEWITDVKNKLFIKGKNTNKEVTEKDHNKNTPKTHNKERIKINWKSLLTPFLFIYKEKYHYLFLLLSSFIIIFALNIGIYNVYSNNTLYVFFFICATAGLVLNVFINYDALTKYGLKPLLLSINVIDIIIGFGFGELGMVIYYNNIKDMPESIPPLSNLLITSLIISLITVCVAFLISYFLKKYLKVKSK